MIQSEIGSMNVALPKNKEDCCCDSLGTGTRGVAILPNSFYTTFVPKEFTMLIGTALLTKVTEMRSQEPPIKTSDIVRACGYESDGKVHYTEFYTQLLDANGTLSKPEPTNISEEYQELYEKLCENHHEEAIEAFLTIWEESDLHGFEDAYVGCYESEKDFAEQYTTDVYGLDVPSFVVIDWEATWNQLSYDYEFVNGYVFVNAW